jgi:hypothetical protein
MDLFAQLLANGLSFSAHYALLGLGFGLIFTTTRIVHFAYAPAFAISSFAAWLPSFAPSPLSPLDEVPQQFADIRYLVQMTDHMDRRMHRIIRQRPQGMARAVGELHHELLRAQPVLR